jgi:hypothetical protein
MTFKSGKPRPPNSGRKKGSTNVTAAAVRDQALAAIRETRGGDVWGALPPKTFLVKRFRPIGPQNRTKDRVKTTGPGRSRHC